jgi:hypothetical protein
VKAEILWSLRGDWDSNEKTWAVLKVGIKALTEVRSTEMLKAGTEDTAHVKQDD